MPDLSAAIATRRRTPRHLIIISSALMLTLGLFIIFLGFPQTTKAESGPGGNIQNATVLNIDIARPAVVRIGSIYSSEATVQLCKGATDSFSQRILTTGSGAFISSHGDVLTAAHVVDLDKADLDFGLLQLLAPQISADLASKCHINLTPDEVVNTFFGTGLYSATFSQPQIRVWLDTSYVGSYSESTISAAKYLAGTVTAESPLTRNDLAILHISMDDTPSIALGDSNGVSPTDNLTIIGYPANGDVNHFDAPKPNDFFDESINQLYVSAIKTNDNGAPLIQVGGNVEHGDSGGPALNAQGQIVGIVSFGGVDNPDGTSFLEAASSVAPLTSQANVDTTPGKFQRSWRQAMTDYASTSSGHWHNAARELQSLQQNYPQFSGVTPYLNFAQQQERTDSASNGVGAFFASQNPTFWIGVVLIVLAIVILIIAITVVSRAARRQAHQTSTAAEPALAVPGAGVVAAPPAAPAYSQPYNYYAYTPPAMPFMTDAAPQPAPSQPTPSYWGAPAESPAPPAPTRPATCVNGHAMQPYEVYCSTCGAPRAQG